VPPPRPLAFRDPAAAAARCAAAGRRPARPPAALLRLLLPAALLPAAALLLLPGRCCPLLHFCPQQLPAATALRCCRRCCSARCCRRRARARSRRRRRRKTQLAEKIFNISILIFSTFNVSNFNILSSQLQYFESQMLNMFSKMLS
jgi:hypothetical protein